MVVTLVVYWASHVYGELVGLRVGSPQRLTRGQVTGLLREESSIVSASFGPLTVILLSAGRADRRAQRCSQRRSPGTKCRSGHRNKALAPVLSALGGSRAAR